jgi:DNA-binding CsgD family transcriptional regulator
MPDATQSKAERNARIYARRIEGRSFAVIGREFGLSPETIRLTVRCMERKARWHEISAISSSFWGRLRSGC